MNRADWQVHDDRVRPYVWSHFALGTLQSILTLSILVHLLATKRLRYLEGVLWDMGWSGFGLWWIYFALLLGLLGFLTLPMRVGDQMIERKFSLSRQTWADWSLDLFKGLLVGMVLGTIVLAVFYSLVQVLQADWWMGAAGFMVLFSVVLAQLAPILLIPLFVKMEPLKEGELKARLLALCSKFGVTVSEVYHLGMGAKTEKGNAAFMGLGPTKRIAIGDTIYKTFSIEEVEAVFAHELGHQVANDVWRSLLLGTFLLFSSFAVAAIVCEHWLFGHLQITFSQPTGLVAFMLVVSLVQVPLGLIQVLHSRSRETAADGFAAKLGFAVPLARALERLTVQNFSLFCPHSLYEFFNYSHPAPWRRIERLRQ